MSNSEWMERVDHACKDMRRCLDSMEGVDGFINCIRPQLIRDFAFALEGGGVVLSDSDQAALFRRLLMHCQKLQKEFSGLRFSPVDGSKYDTRSSFLLLDAAWSLQREKAKEENKSGVLATGDVERELASSISQLNQAIDFISRSGNPEKSIKDTERTDLPKTTPSNFLTIFLEQLDAVTEILVYAERKYRTPKGNSSGRFASNIVKVRLAKIFVNAYTTHFGKYPPITSEGATVNAFQFLCQATMPPKLNTDKASADSSFSGALTKAIRSKKASDERAKHVSETIDRLNRLHPSQ